MNDNQAYFYVYVGSGAISEFLLGALKPYEKSHIKTRAITKDDIVNKNILEKQPENILGLFFPGAISGQAYHDDLGHDGIQRVKDYVAMGGTYEGICAGAYMACRHVSYNEGMKNEKKVTSEWDFFKGTAVGQLDLLQDKQPNPTGWRIANVTTLTFNQTEQTEILYWGGPKLVPAPDEQIDILATYNDVYDGGKPAIAIAAKTYGQGRVVFHGPHSEVSGHSLKTNRTAQSVDDDKGVYRGSLVDKLIPSEKQRSKLFQHTIDEIFKTRRGQQHIEKYRNIPS